MLSAFGIFGAIGTALVAEFLPGVIERIRDEPPVLVALGFDDDYYSEGFGLVVPGSRPLDRDAFAGVRDCNSLLRSARRLGAADVGETFLQLVAEGRTVKDVLITDMYANVIRREKPRNGAYVTCVSAGAVDVIPLFFNLDEARPIARIQKESGVPGERYFSQATVVSLTKGELVPFRITAVTKRSYVEWEIKMEMIIDGQKEVMTLDNDGEPFRTTASLPRSMRYERVYEWAWHEQPPRLVVTSNRSK